MPPATHPIAIVRSPGFDCYGARTTKRVYPGARDFHVETVREFYNRRGGVDDYEVASEAFATLSAALQAAGASMPPDRVAA